MNTHPYMSAWNRQLARERALVRLLDICDIDSAAAQLHEDDDSSCEVRITAEEVTALNERLKERGLVIQGVWDTWHVVKLGSEARAS
jgi:hypothetical protein